MKRKFLVAIPIGIGCWSWGLVYLKLKRIETRVEQAGDMTAHMLDAQIQREFDREFVEIIESNELD